MHCQLCKQKDRYYKCPWIGSRYEPRKWLDAEWILRMMETFHMEAAADRIQTYPFPCTPTIQIDEEWLFDRTWQQCKIRNWEELEKYSADHDGNEGGC
jgi:hypothetical protein